jgi:hypothetical protein
MATFSLPNGWSLEQHHDYDGDFYTVFSPRQKYSGSLNCAIDYGFIMADDSEIEIPPAVMRALECHAARVDF